MSLVINSPTLTNTSSDTSPEDNPLTPFSKGDGCTIEWITSLAATLPAIFPEKDDSSSNKLVFVIPLRVPQSSSVIITSWATSTSFLVKYPEEAVLIAVSDRPFLAPCVDIKYSSTVNPSRKLAKIGRSMISPEGLVIKPLIPAICRIGSGLLLAPESAMM